MRIQNKNPAGDVWILSVLCVAAGSGFYDGPITRQGESYRMCDHMQQKPSTPIMVSYKEVGLRKKEYLSPCLLESF